MSRKSSKSNKKYTSRGKRIIMPVGDVIESDNIENRSPTPTLDGLTPDMRKEFNRNGTDAPEIGESENEKEPYAKNTAELIDKRVFSSKGIPFIVILIIMGLIFAQDNQAKVLTCWGDIWWSIQKCSFFLLLYVVNLLLRLFKKKK